MEPAALRRAATRTWSRTSEGKDLFVQDCTPAPTRPTACRPGHPGIRLAQPVRPEPVHRAAGRPTWPRSSRSSPSSTAPSFKADPARHGTRSEVGHRAQLRDSARSLIGGTSYAGENKKSIFTVLNYLLPLKGVLPMHCSANIGAGGRHGALLRPLGHRQDDAVERPGPPADRRRRARLERSRRVQLRGRLLREDDQAVGRGRAADLRDDAPLRHGARERGRSTRHARRRTSTTTRSPRTRAARIRSSSSTTPVPGGMGGHPHNIVMLTADAFGVLPPIARLSPEGGDVPLPVGLHRQGGGHREGRHRAERHVQHLLRRAVPAAATRTSTRSMLGEQHRQAPVAACGS